MALSKEDRKKLKLVTPKFRGSFVHLTKARKMGLGDDGKEKTPKFGLAIVLPKEDPFWKKVRETMDLAAKLRFNEIPRGLIIPLKDGDEYGYEGMEGCYFISAESEEKPGVVQRIGGELVDVIDPAELYAGAYYRAEVFCSAWAYDERKRKGVRLKLDNVMKIADGEPFSGRGKAADAFAEYVDEDGDNFDPAA